MCVLRDPQMIGRQDPYLKMWVGRAGTKVKTKVHEDGGKVATWNESFMFDLKVSILSCARVVFLSSLVFVCTKFFIKSALVGWV